MNPRYLIATTALTLAFPIASATGQQHTVTKTVTTTTTVTRTTPGTTQQNVEEASTSSSIGTVEQTPAAENQHAQPDVTASQQPSATTDQAQTTPTSGTQATGPIGTSGRTPASAAGTTLPRTASDAPLAGLIGALSLVMAGAFRLRSRKTVLN